MLLLAPLTLLIALVCATANVSIYNDSRKYRYYGCYNETTQIPGSAETRALAGGIDESMPGQMTVPVCLGLCGNGATEYRYAGLEWARQQVVAVEVEVEVEVKHQISIRTDSKSRECWCSQTLSGIAEKLDDGACNFPCEGDNTTACGGSLKLSVYRVSSGGSGLAPSPGLVMALFSAIAVAFFIY